LELQLKTTILSWNLENFYLFPAGLGAYAPIKPPEKVKVIATIIKTIAPDICFFTEVGGENSLSHFNEEFLENGYHVFLKKGNSNRGIENGYLVSKEFLSTHNLFIEHLGHARKPINFLYPHEETENKRLLKGGYKLKHRSHRLSRDLSELQLFKAEDTHRQKPLLIMLGVHLKSKLDKDGIDWQGTKRRQAECRYLSEVYTKRKKRFGDELPIILTGDFNGELHANKRDPEFRDIFSHSELIDFSDALSLPREECVSFVGMDKDKKSFGIQLDYFLLPKNQISKLKKAGCGFYRFRSPQGTIYPLPQNPGARHSMPSDHYPLVVELIL